jgi:hypothetical protein
MVIKAVELDMSVDSSGEYDESDLLEHVVVISYIYTCAGWVSMNRYAFMCCPELSCKCLPWVVTKCLPLLRPPPQPPVSFVS